MKTLKNHIASKIDKMESLERLIFISYYYNQLSIDEIVNETGLSSEKVRKYLMISSNEIIKEVGEGGIYYAALVSFLTMGEEAVVYRPP